MFKKLLSISLILLIASTGLTCVSSANAVNPIIIVGYQNQHYQIASTFDDLTKEEKIKYTLALSSVVSNLTKEGYLSEDGIILKPLIAHYPWAGFDVKVLFLKKPHAVLGE